VGHYYYSVFTWLAARLADRVLTVSEFSRQEIIRRLKVAPEQVVVVPEAPGSHFRTIGDRAHLARVRSKYSLPERFLFNIGIQRPRKNLDRLIEAFSQLPLRSFRGVKLILAGKSDPGFQHVSSLIKQLGLGDRVLVIGEVADEDLPAVYSLARGLVFPSLYEGFGLPVVEAMACGTPVITSRGSALPEVSGDAALLVDPRSVSDIRDGMARVLEDDQLVDLLKSRGYARARLFTWEAAASRTLSVYQEILGKARP